MATARAMTARKGEAMARGTEDDGVAWEAQRHAWDPCSLVRGAVQRSSTSSYSLSPYLGQLRKVMGRYV